MEFTNEDIQKLVKECLLEQSEFLSDSDAKIDAVVIFENLSNNRNEFRHTYDQVVQIFGSGIKDSVIFLGNMASRAKLIDTY